MNLDIVLEWMKTFDGKVTPGGHAACNKQKTIIKNGCDVCSDWKLSEQRRKVAIFWRMREIEERKAQEGAGK